MNDHNLDDLIIDTIAPKNNKRKSFLTIVALLIVVLIVAIILTKTLLKSPDNSELAFEENLSEMIAPELQLQEPKEVTTPEVTKPSEETSLSNIIEEKVSTPKVEEPKEVVEEVTQPTIAETTEISVPVTPEVVKPKPAPKPKPVPAPQAEVKKPVAKPTPKPVQKPAPVKKTSQTSSTGRYYVQVGSFKDNPSKRFLAVIKSSGFKYHISGPDRTGYKKLLIGPYQTRPDVDQARDVIRDRIHKSAFVVEK